MRKEGDKVGLTITATARNRTCLRPSASEADLGWFGDSGNLDGLKQVHSQLQDLASMDGPNGHLKELYEAPARTGVDRENIQVEVRRGVDQVRGHRRSDGAGPAIAMAPCHHPGQPRRGAERW